MASQRVETAFKLLLKMDSLQKQLDRTSEKLNKIARNMRMDEAADYIRMATELSQRVEQETQVRKVK